jgi:type II secretory pathway pseudopilin PulG
MSRFWILKFKRKNAFLLVEVLLTIAILATGLTVLVRSILASLQAGKVTSDYVQAQMLLENNLSLFESQAAIKDGLQIEEAFPSPNERFKFFINTQNIKVNSETGPLNSVIASVSWAAQKRNQKISVSTYLKNEENNEVE